MASVDHYGITVAVETYEDSNYENVPGMGRAVWDADVHRTISVGLAVNPGRRYRADELHAIYRSGAGVLARAALELHDTIRRHETKCGHRCADDRSGLDMACGILGGEGVGYPSSPRMAVIDEEPPYVCLMVPTKHASQWAAYFQRAITELLADDRLPFDTPAAPGDHQAVVNLQSADARSVTP
jgi:hypothetical protein